MTAPPPPVPHPVAHLTSYSAQELNGAQSVSALLYPLQGHFPVELSVYSLSHGYVSIFRSVQYTSLLERAHTFIQHLSALKALRKAASWARQGVLTSVTVAACWPPSTALQCMCTVVGVVLPF